MSWNLFNALILAATLALVLFCSIKLMSKHLGKPARLMLWFVLFSSLVILQVILIDTGLTKHYPILLLFYLPFQFLCPVLFVAFTYAYIDRFTFFKNHRFLFLLPFGIFLVLYTLLKVNVFLDYAWISKGMAAWIGAELDENSALAFSLFGAIWNYRVIRRYEDVLGEFPYQIVIKRTAWLKKMFVTMTVLCFLWMLVIVYLKIDDNVSGHGPYYPLWFLFIAYYVGCLIWGSKHLKQVEDKKSVENAMLRSVNENFQISGFQKIFTKTELITIQESQYQITEVLSYFATSLFDKNTESDVLWDIVKNCISKLQLEDCVIYLHDKKSNVLVQKAAFGDKDMGGKKIASPIEIPLGKGIVGSVAQNLKWEMVNDVSKDSRYVMDVRRAQSELAVPIRYEDILVGVLDSENAQKDFFTEKHLLLFQLIAKLTATKLHQIKKSTSLSLTDDNCYYKQFVSWLETQKTYLDPNLSLQSSSEHLNISTGYLSQIINQLSGINFSEFVNVYRVNAAKKMLINPEFGNYTILAIGLEAGFNSKSAFYNAFKKLTGETPSEYRQRYQMVS